MKKVAVIGSIATDFVVTTEAIPAQGETTVGQSFETFCGGKGANQAVALSRSGLDVFMIGAVGQDSFGRQSIDNLTANCIHTDMVKTVSDGETGSAHIQVMGGDNRIVAVPGANNRVRIDVVKQYQEELLRMDMVVLQNEIPLETVQYAIGFCHRHKIRTVYNPAPAKEIPEEYIDKATYLILNEHEAAVVFGAEGTSSALRKYPGKLIVTLGAQGAVFCDGDKEVPVPGCKVPNVVDTTGAGDTFTGYFVQGIVEGLPLEESVKRGNAASALAIQEKGAQGSIPERGTVERALREKEALSWK